MGARKTDPDSSHEASAGFEDSGEAAKLRCLILGLARDAGTAGITGNEAERLIRSYKNCSVSPRFKELVECGALVRVRLGYGKKGRPIYLKRYDPITKHNVTV